MGVKRFGWDREQATGLVVLIAVALALLVGVGAVFWDGPHIVRVSVPLALLVGAVWIASTNWQRSSLRVVVVFGIALILCSLAAIGRHLNDPASQALDELSSVETAIGQLNEPLGERTASLGKGRDDAREGLRKQLEAIEVTDAGGTYAPQIRNARAVLAAIQPGTETSGIVLTDAVTAFHDTYPSSPLPILDKLKSALDAAVDAFKAATNPPSDVDVRTAIANARTSAQSAPDNIEIEMARVRLELAKYRQAVLQRPEDDDSIKAAQTALKTAMATPPDWKPQSIGVFDAVTAGAREVFAYPSREASGGSLVPEAVAWLLLAAVALAFWRQVELRSARQSAGPVSVELTPFTSGSGDPTGLQEAVFRAALLRNISEPATIPGATLLKSVTDLSELAPAATGLLGKFAELIRSAVEAPVGYSVKGEVVPTDDEPERYRVLVRVSDRATGKDVTVASVAGESPLQACRSAGFWAAGAVLERSSRIPSWARWTPDGAPALAAANDSEDIGADEASPAELSSALARAPDSGVLLHKNADLHDLDGHHFEALSPYSRAVAAHPRYPAARYRLAVSVNMLSRDVKEQWSKEPATARTRVVGQLLRACQAMQLESEQLDQVRRLAQQQPDMARHFLKSISRALFATLLKDSRPYRLVELALRKSERDYFLPLALSLEARGRLLWLLRSASLCTRGNSNTRLRKRVQKRASRPGSWWQLSYNLACQFAVRGRPDDALHWLEVALERPGSGQMAGGWLGQDPDLKSVRNAPRFGWLLGQVDDTRKKAKTGA